MPLFNPPIGPIFFYGAFASLATAVAQAIPPGSGASTSSSDLVEGILAPISGYVSAFRVQFVGNALNVAGQTVTATLLKNGVAVTGASIAGIVTTAGTKTGSVLFAQVAYVGGDVFTVTITPSAPLTAVLTDVMASAG